MHREEGLRQARQASRVLSFAGIFLLVLAGYVVLSTALWYPARGEVALLLTALGVFLVVLGRLRLGYRGSALTREKGGQWAAQETRSASPSSVRGMTEDGGHGTRAPRPIRAGFILVGIWMAAFPGILRLIAGSRLVETDWLLLWGLMAVLGGYIVVIGLTLKPSTIAAPKTR